MSSVSVIIPVFNSRETLERAVASVIYEPQVSEVLIVDDGSTDDSLKLALGLVARFPRLRVLQHSHRANSGACTSRNLGLAHAQSDWIQFLDADDELLPGKIAGQLKLTDRDVGFVVGNSIHVFPDDRRHYRKADNDLWKGLIRSKLGDTCANLWSRKLLLEVNGWDENLQSSQEYDLMFRLVARQVTIVFDPRFLTLIHKTANSISTDPEKRAIRVTNWIQLRQKIRKYLIQNHNFGLKERYVWSGALGLFCKEHNARLPQGVEFVFLWLYSWDMSFRIKINSILKSFE